jgi:hypothetical protein
MGPKITIFHPTVLLKTIWYAIIILIFGADVHFAISMQQSFSHVVCSHHNKGTIAATMGVSMVMLMLHTQAASTTSIHPHGRLIYHNFCIPI